MLYIRPTLWLPGGPALRANVAGRIGIETILGLTNYASKIFRIIGSFSRTSIIWKNRRQNWHNFVHCTIFIASLHNSCKLRLVYFIATSYSYILQLESIYSTMRGLVSNRAGMMSLIKGHSTVMCRIMYFKSKIRHCKITYLFQFCYNITTKLNAY